MKKTILVATREISGGTRKGDAVTAATLKAHDELTAAQTKALGLDQEAVDKLIEDGALIEVPVHSSDDGNAAGGAALKAEKARADKAEADLATAQTELGTLKEKVGELTTQLEAAQAAAAAAPKA